MKNKSRIIFLYLLLSALTIFIHSFNLNSFNWIDIPTHFVGGMVVATFLPKEIFKKKPLLSLFIIAAIGIGWEFFEIAAANTGIFLNLFQETKTDKAIDLAVGLAGLIFIYSKRNATDIIEIKKAVQE